LKNARIYIGSVKSFFALKTGQKIDAIPVVFALVMIDVKCMGLLELLGGLCKEGTHLL